KWRARARAARRAGPGRTRRPRSGWRSGRDARPPLPASAAGSSNQAVRRFSPSPRSAPHARLRARPGARRFPERPRSAPAVRALRPTSPTGRDPRTARAAHARNVWRLSNPSPPGLLREFFLEAAEQARLVVVGETSDHQFAREPPGRFGELCANAAMGGLGYSVAGKL